MESPRLVPIDQNQAVLSTYAPNVVKWPARTKPLPPDSVMVEGQREFVVEQILGHRPAKCRKGKPQMEWLRWAGLGPTEDQWRNYYVINTSTIIGHSMNGLDERTTWCSIRWTWWRKTLQRWKRLQLLRQTSSWKCWYCFAGQAGSVEPALHRYFPNVVSVSVDNEQKFAPTHRC